MASCQAGGGGGHGWTRLARPIRRIKSYLLPHMAMSADRLSFSQALLEVHGSLMPSVVVEVFSSPPSFSRSVSLCKLAANNGRRSSLAVFSLVSVSVSFPSSSPCTSQNVRPSGFVVQSSQDINGQSPSVSSSPPSSTMQQRTGMTTLRGGSPLAFSSSGLSSSPSV